MTMTSAMTMTGGDGGGSEWPVGGSTAPALGPAVGAGLTARVSGYFSIFVFLFFSPKSFSHAIGLGDRM